MKKAFLLVPVIFSIFFVSCKDPEFNLKVSGDFSEAFIGKFLDEQKVLQKKPPEPFYGIGAQEGEMILKSLGGIKTSLDINLATELSGLSLKKVYARQNEKASGRISFHNPVPERLENALEEFRKEKAPFMKVELSSDRRDAVFSCVFPEDTILFSSEKNDGKDVELSEVKDSKKSGHLSIKIKVGKIIITPSKPAEGMDVQAVISRIPQK